VIATATSQRWDPSEVLHVLLAEEAAGRDQTTIRMRRRASGLPAGKTSRDAELCRHARWQGGREARREQALRDRVMRPVGIVAVSA
jgi:hypothetical protein